MNASMKSTSGHGITAHPDLDLPTQHALSVLDSMPIPSGRDGDRYVRAYHHIVATVRRQHQRIQQHQDDVATFLSELADVTAMVPPPPITRDNLNWERCAQLAGCIGLLLLLEARVKARMTPNGHAETET